jgi:putative transposase
MQQRLTHLGFIQSMNRPEGKLTDNAYMESFFHSLKTEGIQGRRFLDNRSIDRHIQSYIPFYNRVRIHSALGYRSPVEFEQQFFRNLVST